MKQIKTEQAAPIIKRVTQIAREINVDYVKEDLLDLGIDSLANRLKIIANVYNCYINSWIGGNPGDNNRGIAECYMAEDYIEDDEATWELITAENEPMAIIGAFKWLADKGYFTPERLKVCNG